MADAGTVFPASAGVFLSLALASRNSKGLPRLGGGVSSAQTTYVFGAVSSPPRRGCFLQEVIDARARNVFPASAGVFPWSARRRRGTFCLPRLGGGVSRGRHGQENGRTSSPPRRGCFLHRHGIRSASRSSPPRRGCFSESVKTVHGGAVFPASAGVFRVRHRRSAIRPRLPRLGGGVSSISKMNAIWIRVFPASAGVFPSY